MFPIYPDAGVVNVLLLDALNTPMVNQGGGAQADDSMLLLNE